MSMVNKPNTRLYCFNVAYKLRGLDKDHYEARQSLAANEPEARKKVCQQVLSYRGVLPEKIELMPAV